ncbi:MAG: transporter related protein [Gemmatimonadetes bacterium]|nr:transporter related protein [Gemmatimonadota bacterium]
MKKTAATVQLEAVRKEYDGGVVAVHGVDLTVQAGELVVLVGPSGCGKSTTLRMVAGLETITSGRLSIGGRVVNDVPPSERDIAMVFQSYALYPHMTVRENMGFALRLRKRPAREIETQVNEAAETLGLTQYLDRQPRQLSGGQRQRVAIGRAIVREPSVFLFDEPLSNLDAALRGEMRRELAELHSRLGATMLYVTHDQIEAMTLGDRIVVMHQGRVRQVDTPELVYQRPADTFVAGFLGSPPMNLMPGVLVGDGERTLVRPDAAPSLAIAAPSLNVLERLPQSGAVVLGVRPEHLRTSASDGTSADGFDAIVELAEALGHEQLLHLRVEGVPLTVRGAPGVRPAVGSHVKVHADPAHVHLFDAASGVSLRRAD